MKELVAAGPPPAGAAPAGPPPQVVELGALGPRVGAAGAFLDVMVVVILGNHGLEARRLTRPRPTSDAARLVVA